MEKLKKNLLIIAVIIGYTISYSIDAKGQPKLCDLPVHKEYKLTLTLEDYKYLYYRYLAPPPVTNMYPEISFSPFLINTKIYALQVEIKKKDTKTLKLIPFRHNDIICKINKVDMVLEPFGSFNEIKVEKVLNRLQKQLVLEAKNSITIIRKNKKFRFNILIKKSKKK